MSPKIRLVAAISALGLVATAGPAAALPGWRTTPTVHRHNAASHVLDLRYAEHPGFDRVVIDVRRHLSGYRISYTKRLTYDASGQKVPLKGRKKLLLTLRPAYAHNAKGDNIYRGPTLVQVQLPTLRGVAFIGDFEGVVSFGFTTRRKAPYRIFTLTNPRRIVIDWKHPAP
jgi:hypothetical protein